MPRKKKELPKRKDGLYEVKVTVGKNYDGTPIRKSFYSSISKEDAKKQATEFKLEMEIASRTGQGFVDRTITFAEWATQWMEVYKKPQVSENTYYTNYVYPITKYIVPHFQNIKLVDIKPIHIQQFYMKFQHLSTSALSKMQVCFNGIFETAIDNEICYKNPARNIKYTSAAQKHIKQVYTDEEIEIVERLATEKMPEVVLLLETGIRKGELLGLTWNDIDLRNQTISINRSIAYKKGSENGIVQPPKMDSYRTNPLSSKALLILKKLAHKSKKGYLFPGDMQKPQQPYQFDTSLTLFMNELPENIPRLTAHELRHTYGTYLRRKGVDIYTIQKIMGHKDIRMTTEIYVHNEIDALRQGLEVIEGGKIIKEQLS